LEEEVESQFMMTVQTTSGLERRMEVQIPAERVQKEVDRRLLDMGSKAQLDGFQPGKAPAAVIRERFGEQIHRETIDELMRSTFTEAVTEQKLEPVGEPRIEPISTLAGQDLKYAAVFEIYPKIEMRGLQDLKVERPVTEITEADIDAMIDSVRSQQPQLNEGKEVRRRVAENMRDQVEEAIQEQIREQLLGQLLAANPLELLPKALVESQIDALQSLARRNDGSKATQLPLRENFIEAARRCVTLDLLLNEIMRVEEIKPDPAKVQSRLERIVRAAHNEQAHHHADPQGHQRHLEEMMQSYRQDAKAMYQIETEAVVDQIFESLLARAKVTEQRKSFKELTNSGVKTLF
jgi:FKBP-type peptidyl-prolyl cis-trans isomerase (trigger factor)